MERPHLSIVIPAYNEEKRLPRTLERLFTYLPTLGRSWEIVISDDGSTDATRDIVEMLGRKHPGLRLTGDGGNRGRGVAVRKGIEAARGEYILETDADGSVADEAIGRFLAALERDQKLGAIFGSRELPESRVVKWQPPLRVFLGYGFLYLTRMIFFMWSVSDFTLGFKMFKASAARDIFAHQFDPFYVAEAEIVFVTRVRRHKNIELPVTWSDDRDSRIKPFRDLLRSLRGLALVLLRFASGKYR